MMDSAGTTAFGTGGAECGGDEASRSTESNRIDSIRLEFISSCGTPWKRSKGNHAVHQIIDPLFRSITRGFGPPNMGHQRPKQNRYVTVSHEDYRRNASIVSLF